MKLLYITPYYKPSWFYGGPPKCISEQAEYLTKHFECTIDVVTLNQNGQEELFESNGKVVVKEIEGVTVHYLPASTTKWGQAYYASPLLKKYLHNFKKHDLIHIHTLFNAFSTIGARFAIKNKIPFGYSVHGMLDAFSLTRSKWMKKFHRFMFEDQYLLMADFVHFTTENERKNAVLSKRAKTVVIPLGMKYEAFVEYKKSYSYYDLRLIYISRINRKKGLDLLLNALSLLPSYMKDRVSLDIYGEDDDNFLQELKKIVELNQLRKCVVFKGKLNPANRNETLQQYDVLVLTSHQENFGLVVAEALDQKIPVLISDKVNLCDVVEQNQCGWVSPLKIDNIVKKIEEAFRTPKHIRQQMGEKGHALVRENYAFEKVGVMYWQLYEKTVNR